MTSSRWPAERLETASYLGPGVDLPVFYGDLDTGGHVNNVTFGRFFEQGRFLAHRDAGFPSVLAEEGSVVLVARVSIDYLQQGRFGHPLHVRTRLARVGTASFHEEQAAWQDGRCVALSEVTMVYARDDRPAPLSEGMRAALARLQPAVITS